MAEQNVVEQECKRVTSGGKENERIEIRGVDSEQAGKKQWPSGCAQGCEDVGKP